MSKKSGLGSSITGFGFVRSIIMRVLAIFSVVFVIIAAVALYSFTSELRRNTLLERQNQLVNVEKTISDRMKEIISIAYNIGNDSAFYLEPVDDTPNSSREMSEMLGRYLVGNNFIEHLAYCRAAEPDKIYVRTGERSLTGFFKASFGMDEETSAEIIPKIHGENKPSVRITGNEENSFFTYSYPLPPLAVKPKAHVLVMVPVEEFKRMLDAQLLNGKGEALIYDGNGSLIYRTGNIEEELELSAFVAGAEAQVDYTSANGQRYVLQKVSSEMNRWTYVSVMRHSDTFPGLADKQIGLLVFVLLTLVAAIAVMLWSIITQYKPISQLAAQVSEDGGDAAPMDERTLLSDKIAMLRDDSQQKQRYETAFYEAEAASRAKSAFLSSMSHDIRTPMNAIIGMTAIARKHIGDQAYVDECLQKVQASSDYLLDIINNVLDMSRIESGRIPIAREPVVLPALIDSVVSLMTTGVEAKSQTLTVDIGELKQNVVMGDNIHIVQVFVNILSNAVKFTPEGGAITLRARQLPSEDAESGRYEFTFTDTGIGIPPEFIDHVFDTFSRVDSPGVSQTEGTGLGMAIAKKLVELMGGTVECESELGRGTTFTVTMDMEYADEKEVGPYGGLFNRRHSGQSEADDAVVELTGKRILLVEDNAMNREIAGAIIRETGVEIVEANNGREAVEIFAAHPDGYFDLIFMDIQMPVMNGYEATAAIRAMDRPDAQTVLIYAMTANTFDEDVRQVKDAGMNGHVGKPYNPQTLYKLLAAALG